MSDTALKWTFWAIACVCVSTAFLLRDVGHVGEFLMSLGISSFLTSAILVIKNIR